MNDFDWFVFGGYVDFNYLEVISDIIYVIKVLLKECN